MFGICIAHLSQSRCGIPFRPDGSGCMLQRRFLIINSDSHHLFGFQTLPPRLIFPFLNDEFNGFDGSAGFRVATISDCPEAITILFQQLFRSGLTWSELFLGKYPDTSCNPRLSWSCPEYCGGKCAAKYRPAMIKSQDRISTNCFAAKQEIL
jgi:hypothetical protein